MLPELVQRREQIGGSNVNNIYSDIRPELIERERGGWLAVSGPGSELRIGTVGETADQAADRFDEALAEWARLAAAPDSQPR